MPTKTPPPRSNTLHNAAGTLLSAAEATAVAAGDTIQYQNTGNVILRVVVTTPGTGTVNAIIPANNLPITLAVGDNLLGPYDQAIFGSTVTITTSAAIGSVGTYLMPARLPNGQRNPFEQNPLAVDSL